jgi:ankyrin repeat protein
VRNFLLLAFIKSFECGKVSIVKFLLKNGAKIDAQNKSGNTPLMCASLLNQADVVQLLVENRADIDITECYHQTELLLAVESADGRIVGYFLDNGARNAFEIEVDPYSEDSASESDESNEREIQSRKRKVLLPSALSYSALSYAVDSYSENALKPSLIGTCRNTKDLGQ